LVRLRKWTAEELQREREAWSRHGPYRPDLVPEYVAIHEAGHAIAACRFRYGFVFAKVLFNSGAVVPLDYWPKDREYLLRRLIGNMAGSFAQARYSKKSAVSLWTKSEDFKRAKPLLHAASTTPEELAVHVRPFLREYWEPVNALADIIQARGFIEHGEPDVLAITGNVKRLAGC
jgi:hypothetical protein